MAARIGTGRVDAKQFEMLARSTRAWLESAQNLRASARAVWKQFEVDRAEEAAWDGKSLPSPKLANHLERAWCLLVALMLENVFKGTMIAKKPDRVTAKALGDVGGHNLVVLASHAGLRPDQRERELLEFLSFATVGFGRYPVAVKPAEMPSEWEADFAGAALMVEQIFARAVREMFRVQPPTRRWLYGREVTTEEAIRWNVEGVLAPLNNVTKVDASGGA